MPPRDEVPIEFNRTKVVVQEYTVDAAPLAQALGDAAISVRNLLGSTTPSDQTIRNEARSAANRAVSAAGAAFKPKVRIKYSCTGDCENLAAVTIDKLYSRMLLPRTLSFGISIPIVGDLGASVEFDAEVNGEIYLTEPCQPEGSRRLRQFSIDWFADITVSFGPASAGGAVLLDEKQQFVVTPCCTEGGWFSDAKPVTSPGD